jgi:hypothetical protein
MSEENYFNQDNKENSNVPKDHQDEEFLYNEGEQEEQTYQDSNYQIPSYLSRWVEEQSLNIQRQQEQMFLRTEQMMAKMMLQFQRTPASAIIQRARDSIPNDGLNTILKNDPYAQVQESSQKPAANNKVDDKNGDERSKTADRNSTKVAGQDPERRRSASFIPFVSSFMGSSYNKQQQEEVMAKPSANPNVNNADIGNRKPSAAEVAEAKVQSSKSPTNSDDFFCYDAIHNPGSQNDIEEEQQPNDQAKLHIDSFAKIREFRRTSFTSNEARKQKRLAAAPSQQSNTVPNTTVDQAAVSKINNAMLSQSNNKRDHTNYNVNQNNYGGGNVAPNYNTKNNPPPPPPSGGGPPPVVPSAPPFVPPVTPSHSGMPSSAYSLTPIVYSAKLPSVAHIYLPDLKIDSILKFIDDWEEYIIAHRVEPSSIATRIATPVRDQLCSQYDGMHIAIFYSLSREDLFRILRCECRPRTVLSFILNLQKYVKFEKPADRNYIPSLLNFKPFYDALLKYNALFKRYLAIMSEDNAENVPAISAKENGLVKVYLDEIPHDYGHRVWKSFKRSDYFNTWYDFESKFWAVVRDHFEKCEMSRCVSEHFNRGVFSSNNAVVTSSRTSSYSSNNTSYKKKQSGKNNVRFGFNNMQEVEHDESATEVDEPEQYPDFHMGVPEYVAEDIIQAEDGYNTAPEDSSHYQTAEEPPDYDTPDEDDDETDFNERLHAMTNPQHKQRSNNNHSNQKKILPPKKSNNGYLRSPAPSSVVTRQNSNTPSGRSNVPNGCFSMILNNSCAKGDKCSYSHDFQVLQKTCAQQAKALDSSRYNPRNIRNPVGNRSIVNHMASTDDSTQSS